LGDLMDNINHWMYKRLNVRDLLQLNLFVHTIFSFFLKKNNLTYIFGSVIYLHLHGLFHLYHLTSKSLAA